MSPALYLILPQGPDLRVTQRSLGHWYQMSIYFPVCSIPQLSVFHSRKSAWYRRKSPGQNAERQDVRPSSATNKSWSESKSLTFSETQLPPFEKSKQLHLLSPGDGGEPSRSLHTDSLLPKASQLSLQVVESAIVFG